jgi:hypothetical protein
VNEPHANAGGLEARQEIGKRVAKRAEDEKLVVGHSLLLGDDGEERVEFRVVLQLACARCQRLDLVPELSDLVRHENTPVDVGLAQLLFREATLQKVAHEWREAVDGAGRLTFEH